MVPEALLEIMSAERIAEWLWTHPSQEGIVDNEVCWHHDQPTKFALVVEDELSSAECNDSPCLWTFEFEGLIEQQLTGHAQVSEDGKPLVEVDHEHLAPASNTSYLTTNCTSRVNASARERFLPRGPNPCDGQTNEVVAQLTTNGLYLGKFRHRSIIVFKAVGDEQTVAPTRRSVCGLGNAPVAELPKTWDDRAMTNNNGAEQPVHRRHQINRNRGAVVSVGIFALAVITFSSMPPKDSEPVVTTTTLATTTTNPIDKANVRVQVYNGTAVNGAASKVTHDLTVNGWATLPAEQDNVTTTASFVAFASGYQAAAQQIARELGLTSSSVELLTDTTASPPPAVGTNVAVIVGLDLAS